MHLCRSIHRMQTAGLSVPFFSCGRAPAGGPQDYAGLVSHAAHREAGRRGTSVPIQIAVRCVIGVLVALVAIAATEPEASAAMKVIAAAAHLGMLTRQTATEGRATAGEMASAKAAAHAGAASELAHVSAAEPAAHVAAAH